jgi:phytanoyl-CoA hydroxylase
MTVISRAHWEQNRPWIDDCASDIGKYIARAAKTCNFDLSQKLHEWRERGIVIFENVVAPELIDRYLADLEHLVSHHTKYDLTVEHAAKRKPINQYVRAELDLDHIKLNNVHTISEAACRLSLTQEICEFINHIFEGPACLLQSLTFIKGSQQPAHIDYPYVRSQTKLAHLVASWIPLEDVNPRSGPLAYYPGSHKIEASGFFDWGNGSVLLEPDSVRTPMEFAHHLWARMKQVGIDPVVYCPKKGDVLIWHGNLVHQGIPIQEPGLTRRSYISHYTCLDGYPPTFKTKDAFESSAYFTQHGGYVFDFPWAINGPKLPSWKRGVAA